MATPSQTDNDQTYAEALKAWHQKNIDTDQYRRIEHEAYMDLSRREQDVFRLQKEAAELQIRYFKTLLQEDE